MAEMVKVKTMEIRNVNVDIYVSMWRDNANFLAYRAGTTDLGYANRLAEAGTMGELVKTLKQKLRERAATVHVPFEQINDGAIRRGVGRGIHQKEHDVLVTWLETKEKDQIGRWHSQRNVLVPLTGEMRDQIAKAARIHRESARQAERAEQWLKALVKPYEMDLHAEVEKAIRLRAQAMAAEEEKGEVA